jgi:hypothetical protein
MGKSSFSLRDVSEPVRQHTQPKIQRASVILQFKGGNGGRSFSHRNGLGVHHEIHIAVLSSMVLITPSSKEKVSKGALSGDRSANSLFPMTLRINR